SLPTQGAGKAEEFQGSLFRLQETSADLKTADLYTFKGFAQKVLDQPSCEKVLAEIFGPLGENALEIGSLVLHESSSGVVCEVQILDEQGSGRKVPERRVVIGFLGQNVAALVFRFSAAAPPQAR